MGRGASSPLSGFDSLSLALGVSLGAAAGAWFVSRQTVSKSSLLLGRRTYKPGQAPSLPPSMVASGNSNPRVHVFDPAKLASAYNLMISTVTPRPIALVSTSDLDNGVDNLAPFSYFGAVGHNPPMLAIGFCRNRGGALKDSISNLMEYRQCAVHIISEWYLDAANHTCGAFPPSTDEFSESGLSKVYDCQAINSKIPRVQEAAVMFECELEYIHHVTTSKGGEEIPTTEIALVRVVRIHVHESVLADNIDLAKPVVDTVGRLLPIGRLGGNVYSTIGETVDIARPKV